MGEALRDAYALACVELDAACEALKAAQTRVEVAREQCAALEAQLGMTTLQDEPFPQLSDESGKAGCTAAPRAVRGAR